jgi:hypothetical protein
MAAMNTSVKEMATMRIRRLALLCVSAALIAFAPAAHAADFGIDSFHTTVTDSQAGGHPDLSTIVNYTLNDDGSPADRGKDLAISLPQGFLGNPNALPICPLQVLLSSQHCDPATQVGVLTLIFDFLGSTSPFPVPVYHVTTQPGHAASFAAVALIPTVMINADIGPGNGYRLTTSIRNASEAIPLAGSQVDFWGVPADPSHDAARGGPADSPRKPFLTYPTDCSAGDLQASADATAWGAPAKHVIATSSLPAPTGCNQLSVNPSLNVAPGTSQADSPSGYAINIHVPQNDDPDGLATPTLRHLAVTLPEGVSLAPGGADGLAACSDAQLGATTDDPAACPDAAKIGKVQIDSPLQADPLQGALYLGAPTLADPYRLFLVATGPGTLIKLVGRVTADPSTGQLTTTFDDSPQLPFSDLTLTLFGGDRGVLANPQSCGTKTATSQLTAWTGQNSTPSSAFDITGCASPQPFAPAFLTGTTDTQAGASTTLTLQVRRPDGNQNLSGITADLPPGISADVASVPECPDSQAAAGTCSEDSRIGTATVASGAGGHPFWLTGKVYLTGPYKGSPFGLSIVVPAVAGPLDLGTVVLRVAVGVDPTDAHFHVVSDALPQILQGIPLRLRTVSVTLDRPNFVRNPTSCAAKTATGVITSAAGATANVSSPFAATGCKQLPFAPTLTAKFTGGRSQTKKNKHPGIAVTLKQKPGQAAARRVVLTLPSSVALDATRLSLCSRDQWTSDSCPAASQVGTAKATTPILSRPLAGPIYLVNSGGLPVIGVQLNGQVKLRLEGQSSVVGTRIRSTFATVPDVPLGSFLLTFQGGSKGILKTGRNLCSARQSAGLQMVGQNGISRSRTVTVSRSCKKK